jgi:hypothetical protein
MASRDIGEGVSMRVVLGLVLGLAMPATSAWAEEWRLIGATSDFSSAIDLASVSGPATAKSAWTLRVFRTRQPSGFDYALIQREFDCTRNTTAMTAFAAYSREGEVVVSNQTRGETAAVFPSSMGAMEKASACEGVSSEAAGPFPNVSTTVSMIELLHSHQPEADRP